MWNDSMSSVRRSFAWSAAEQIAPKFFGLFITVALARLLEPSHYGLMALLAIFLALAKVFADLGLSASLIQRKDLSADDETSVFVLNIAIGLLLSLGLAFASPWVAKFYGEPLMVPMLLVLSASVFVSSFAVVQGALLSRRMQFKTIATVATVSMVVSGLIAVAMAQLGFGVWSLVSIHVSTSLVEVALYWKLGSWRPTGRLSRDSIVSMWSFSSYLLYSRVISVVYQNMYTAIIGKVYSPEVLGLYDKANKLRMAPAGMLSGMVGRVSFPLFSRAQDDKPLLLRQVRQIIRASLMLSAAALTLLAVTADPLIPLVLSEKWRGAVPLLRILCYAGVFYPIHSLYLMALQAQGHSKLNFKLENIKVAIGLSTVAVVYPYGVVTLAWAVVGLTLVAYFLNAWFNVKLLGYRWRMQAFDILPTLVLCFASGWTAWLAGSGWLHMPLLALTVQVAVFLAACAGGIFLMRRTLFADLWGRIGEVSIWLRAKFD